MIYGKIGNEIVEVSHFTRNALQCDNDANIRQDIDIYVYITQTGVSHPSLDHLYCVLSTIGTIPVIMLCISKPLSF